MKISIKKKHLKNSKGFYNMFNCALALASKEHFQKERVMVDTERVLDEVDKEIAILNKRYIVFKYYVDQFLCFFVKNDETIIRNIEYKKGSNKVFSQKIHR